MGTPTINTIMTHVVRYGMQVDIEMNGRIHTVEWSKMHAEPQVIEPGTTAINHHGLVDVIVWLRSLPSGATYRVIADKRKVVAE